MASPQLSGAETQFIHDIVAERGASRDQLLPILEALQTEYSWVNPAAQQLIADLLGIHPVEVNSVVSFYAFLNNEPGGKFRLRLCSTISCELAGKTVIANQLEKTLGINFGETTPDGMFTLEYAACMGMCDQGPALLVNDQVITQLRPEGVRDIIEMCRKQAAVPVSQEEG